MKLDQKRMKKKTLAELYAQHLVDMGITETPHDTVARYAAEIENLQALLRRERLETARLTALLDTTVGEYAA